MEGRAYSAKAVVWSAARRQEEAVEGVSQLSGSGYELDVGSVACAATSPAYVLHFKVSHFELFWS